MEIGPPVLEKKIFEGVFTIYGHGGHLGHVTSILLTNFGEDDFLKVFTIHGRCGHLGHVTSIMS